MSKDEGVLICGGGPHDCRSVANKIINSRLAEGLPVTHMQVQALVYLCHSWMLALYGELLLAQPIQAFSGGTFLPDLWNSLCRYGDLPVRRPIDLPSVGVERREYDPRQVRVICRVLDEYGWMSERRLYRLVNACGTPSDMANYYYLMYGVEGLARVSRWETWPGRFFGICRLARLLCVRTRMLASFTRAGLTIHLHAFCPTR